jgi:outer membrane protein OmpA-like peptidoglycan-associated protein
MMQKTCPIIATLGLSVLVGCGDTRPFASFNEEAGGFLNGGTFGVATMNNQNFHNGTQSFTVDLNKRFSAEVPPTVTFAFNSAVLDGEARSVLDLQANWIRQFPEIRFKVYGHTDLVGSAAYNKNLGRRRANAVVAYLETRGISRSRLEALVSFGETRPLIYTEMEERQNRRATTEVAGLVQGHPQTLNGKYAEIIFREYVESATELPPSQESGLEALTSGEG